MDGGLLSEPYLIQRCVKQGSVLSPALFLLGMDPLLRVLEQSGLSLSVNNFYAGGFLELVSECQLPECQLSKYQLPKYKF